MSMRNDWLSELREQWEALIAQIKSNELDMEMFKSVAKDTFEVLFENREEDFVAKNMMGLVLSIQAFGMADYDGKENAELERAAQSVALSFCNQFTYQWDDDMSSTAMGKKFVVMSDDDEKTCYLIKTDEFDLSVIVEKRGGFTYDDDDEEEDDDFFDDFYEDDEDYE